MHAFIIEIDPEVEYLHLEVKQLAFAQKSKFQEEKSFREKRFGYALCDRWKAVFFKAFIGFSK